MPRKIDWQNPQALIYEDNYGYGMNFYQPMIDYIDAKDKGGRAERPHLPWSNERGLEKYSPRKTVRCYSPEDLTRISRQTEARVKTKLKDFKATTKSKFQLEASVSAATITKKVHTEAKKAKKIIKEIDKIKNKMAAEDVKYEPDMKKLVQEGLKSAQKYLQGKTAKGIEGQLLAEARKNIAEGIVGEIDVKKYQRNAYYNTYDTTAHARMMGERMQKELEASFMRPLDDLSADLKGFDKKTTEYFFDKSKQTSIEIELLNARVVEAETKLKSEVARIKKKLQIQITELEMSLDAANKTNIDLQKTIKKQSLTLTELQAHYDEVQRQLSVTLDQLSISQRRVQALTAEVEEIRGNYESALRSKRAVELQYEECITRINELTTINVNLASAKSKIEQELGAIAADYDEVTKELRISDERYQRVQVEIKHTTELLHEEQERVVKIEAIRKSLEIEVKNLSIRLEEVEANAIVGGKRIISKLEARIHDIELELDEEKRRHAETIKILRKKERSVKELMIQCEEDQKNITILQETLEKSNQKVGLFKRQLQEQEGVSQQSVTRVRRFQRELEAAEDRADTAESSLSLIRAKHRTFVTTSTVPGSQVYLVQDTRTAEL
ncbi:myotonic dystrophy s/t kinase-related [Holotrichia oblita]|uniref:Myotonic dystrophy s/t kinase-related n=3 Tax=Holotrichia oblita TaxID=644536 RepID=A0ACB9TXI6_HOLOL|nr:myotonic dystrophy s/t kinase-related [Holotrichia oblita]KAI4471700.1 myotonic dystrophy s/t kinase-related [Holotrichia oblita]KAI4471713.1 myotonic dystrophy s/t kinase-related [Holotrichia oblita]